MELEEHKATTACIQNKLSAGQVTSDHCIPRYVSQLEVGIKGSKDSNNRGEPVNVNVQTIVKTLEFHLHSQNSDSMHQPITVNVRSGGRKLGEIPSTSHSSFDSTSLMNQRRGPLSPIYSSSSDIGMKSTAMDTFRNTLNQLLNNGRKRVEFNHRVQKPKGPRALPASWQKPRS
ncbi:uncharacterized protein LOC103176620 [Callorhinchus milii]|uniref:uncharacterized protein LOC103176620 n=1 Tax=Callorhinchus milii TaxID=7868 RepID=UPI000457169C|nr:uncharacterized protein LOC103176620 [Callorhinchus milii]|eukprot:gi/632946243/ref/XP_007888462.1/ PREDICTED: uncharacterized protein LOC103176620 [Callorhinchus milii]